jgi:GTP-binding protein HflX
MAKLRSQIKSFGPSRETKRANRKRTGVASVAIAGYTNAGKSSLLNRITGAGVLVEDALFATLDATVRKAKTPSGRAFTLTDTVGFVRQLPHELVEAFRSTLEEVAGADLIIHVVDATHSDPGAQLHTVRDVIADVGARDIPEIIVFNKVDRVNPSTTMMLRGLEPRALFVSAATGEGVDLLLKEIDRRLPGPTIPLKVLIPFDRGDLVALLHDEAILQSSNYEEQGTRVEALIEERHLDKFAPYVVGG